MMFKVMRAYFSPYLLCMFTKHLQKLNRDAIFIVVERYEHTQMPRLRYLFYKNTREEQPL